MTGRVAVWILTERVTLKTAQNFLYAKDLMEDNVPDLSQPDTIVPITGSITPA
ncbi:MAG: hypothetical protein AB1423_16885 [Pseudomonadota bacterium]